MKLTNMRTERTVRTCLSHPICLLGVLLYQDMMDASVTPSNSITRSQVSWQGPDFTRLTLTSFPAVVKPPGVEDEFVVVVMFSLVEV